MPQNDFRKRVETIARYVNAPYTNFLDRLGLAIEFVRAEGARIYDRDDRMYIDCVAGYGNLNLGHNHPRVINAVIEELLEGEEASFIAICDGENVLPLASSQDHKRVFDHDEGPNTGGMGAYSPAPIVDDAMTSAVMEKILYPLVAGLKKQGITYKGVLYAGLMITPSGPSVLEFNVRMGDPETQPLLMRCKSDIVPVLLEVAKGGSIRDYKLEWEGGPSVCVVMASGGYPGAIEKGMAISGIDQADKIEGVKVFHAGTRIQGKAFVTNGGRVLGVTAVGGDLKDAIAKAYQGASLISFEKMHYRKDIGHKALKRLS